MPNTIPYPLAVQVVLLNKVKQDTIAAFLKDPSVLEFSSELTTYFPELELETIPLPWTLDSVLSHSQIGIQKQWSLLVSRGFVESKSTITDSEPCWTLTSSGESHLKDLIALFQNPLFLTDMNALFEKYLKKLVELDKTQLEWQTLSSSLGTTTESEVSIKLKEHMQHLHRFNEFKDIAQKIMGQLASKSGKTMKQMYEELGLDLDEDAPNE